MELVSPNSGRPLAPDSRHSLSDGAGERWPIVDGIPYLRVGRETLVAEALAALDAGREEDALVLLLADQDDWWTGPATDEGELRRLVRERDTLTLRDAMALLRFGPVADYFAYRWSDPTYLAGLALLEAHWNEPASAFELACGIGHYLRELTRRGVACVGADVVFAKCWLAKGWIAPEAEYVVYDAGAAWPTGEARYDLVMCHDAFYFLPQQERVAGQLRGLLSERGVLTITRLRNASYIGFNGGQAKTLHEWLALFPSAIFYDEEELTWQLCRADRPRSGPWVDDEEDVPAYSIVEGLIHEPRALTGGLAMPLAGASLRGNPLRPQYSEQAIAWPSARYGAEYGPRSYWAMKDEDLLKAGGGIDPVRLRRVVDLPERW